MTKGLHELRSGVECVDGRRGGTGRKRAEAHRLTFDQAAVGIAHIGLDLRIQQANPCLCAMTGCSMEELSGMSLVELLHPEDRLVAAEERREVLAGAPQPHHGEAQRSQGWGRVTASLRRDLEGRPMSAIGVMDDITVRPEAEEKLRLVVGLALVQRLSALHGGTVSVESRLGMGSRSSVTIPLQGGE